MGIADCCEIEPAAAGSILLRMETAGLVTRRNRPDNRRSLYVSLPPKGFTTLSMGNWIIIIFSLYIVLQFVLQGKNFQPWRILQLICTTRFSYFTDFTNLLAEMFLPDPALMTFAPAVVYGVLRHREPLRWQWRDLVRNVPEPSVAVLLDMSVY